MANKLEPYDDFIGDPDREVAELELNERELMNRAEGGELFEPDIPREKWEEFRKLATQEENARRTYTKPDFSEEEQKLLERADVLRDEQTEALLERRDALMGKVRPQCADPNDEGEADEVEKLVNEAFGIDDWGDIDTSIGRGV